MPTVPGVRIDTFAFPLVIFTQFQASTVEMYDRVETFFQWLHRRQQRVLIVYDVIMAEVPEAAVRRRIVAMSEKLSEENARWVASNIMICRSTLMRGALKAIQWMSKYTKDNPLEQHIVASRAEAAELALSRLHHYEMLTPLIADKLKRFGQRDTGVDSG